MPFPRTRIMIYALTAAMLASSSHAQSLKLIPMPRELRPASTQPLSGGIQIHCADPCAPEDAFAIEDLKAYLLSLNIPVNNSAFSTSSSPATAHPTQNPSTPPASPPAPPKPRCPKP